MSRPIRCAIVLVCMMWPGLALAQSQASPSREDAERNAFQTPTTGRSGGGQTDASTSRERQPLSGSQGPSTNPEGKNITEPEGHPSSPSPSGPAK
jgi:hypothetical protein